MKIGLIGNWGHVVCVLDEFDHLDDVDIVAIAPGYEAESVATLAQRYSQATVYQTYGRLLNEAEVDAVIISTRLDYIAGIAKNVLKAGIHCICEKPMADTMEDLQELWTLAREHQAQCLAMLPNRNQKVLWEGRRVIEAGTIGQVKLLNVRKSYKFSFNREKWLQRRASFGGLITWVGIHAFDYLDSIVDLDISDMFAAHANSTYKQFPEIEDIATVNMRLRNGVLCTATIDYLRSPGANCHGDDWVRVVGTEGSIEIAMERGYCYLITKDGERQFVPEGENVDYYAPILREALAQKTYEVLPAMRRSFTLNQYVLVARDSADTVSLAKDIPHLFQD